MKTFTIIIIFFVCFMAVISVNCQNEIDGIDNTKYNIHKLKYGLFYNASAVKTGIVAPNLNNIIPSRSVTNLGLGNYYGLYLLYDLGNDTNKKINVGLRLSFLNNMFDLDYEIYNSTTQTIENLHIKNTFDYISFAPVIQTNIYENLNALFGVQFNFPILAEGIFNYNLRDVTIYPTSTFQPRLQFGFNYHIPIGKNRSFHIIPEVNIIYGLTNDVGGNFEGNWTSNYFTAGLSVQYNRANPIAEEEIEQIEYENILQIDTIKRIAKVENEMIKEGNVFLKDTIMKKIAGKTIVQYVSRKIDTMFIPRKALFEVKMNVTAFNKEGGVRVDSNFVISSSDEYIFLEEIPLLNKIFFDRNSSLIPNRYNLKINSENRINMSIIDTYHNILNIVGQRMADNNSYTIKLVGCNDNNTDEEKDNLELSEARAESVKNYLVDNWNINDNRIIVEVRGLPEYPSLKETELLKMEENRRVEMYSNDNSLFSSVVNENRLMASDFDRLKIDATILTNEGIKKYVVLQKINNKIVRDISVDEPDGITGTYNITEYLPIDIQDIFEDTEMEIVFIVTTNSNDIKTNRITFPIIYSDDILAITSKEMNNKAKNKSIYTDVDKNYLILFELNDTKISNDGMEMIDNIKRNLSPNSQVYIVGYADINGNKSLNRRLASSRADKIKKAMNISDVIVDYSTNMKPFDNSLPEGRFYSRVVEINISTKK